jgi:hypothetical protein
LTGTQLEVTCGFSTEVMLPWRLTDDGHKDVGLPVNMKKVKDMSKEVIAEWPNGDKQSIPNFKYSDLVALSGSRSAPEAGFLYEVESAVSKNRIVVTQKVDRSLLIIVQEQSKQVLMVKASIFGTVPDETKRMDPNSDTIIKAVAFLKPIVNKFAKGDLQRHELTSARDAALESAGLASKRTKRASTPRAMMPSKRPAAARTSPSVSAPEASSSSKPCEAKSPVPPRVYEDPVGQQPSMDSYQTMLSFFR